MHKRVISYAQNREDLLLAGFFDENEKGFYIDVGANEPTHESVTKIFYDRGWHGINIEPIPVLHEKLEQERPRDINLAIGIGSKKGTAKLHYYPDGDGLSTMSDEMVKGYRKNPSVFTAKEQEIEIQVLTLKDILTKYAKGKKINFMKVDVEGFEYDVLEGNDWAKFRPEVICIEANHIERDWRKFLTKQKYSLVFFDGLNNYYADENTNRAKKFDYIQAIIFKEPIMNFRLIQDFKEYDEVVAWLETTNKALKIENEAAQRDIRILQTTLDQITPLRRHIKTQLRHNFRKVDKRISQKLARQGDFHAVDVSQDILSSNGEDLLSTAHSTDEANFELYKKRQKPHPLYPVYDTSKRITYKTVRKTQAIVRKKAK